MSIRREGRSRLKRDRLSTRRGEGVGECGILRAARSEAWDVMAGAVPPPFPETRCYVEIDF